MSYALMTCTQPTYQFSFTVNVNINADRTLLFVVALVAFVMWKVKVWTLNLWLLIGDIKAAIGFTSTLFTIGFKSLAFGMGVRL